jgi:uncharacterized protein
LKSNARRLGVYAYLMPANSTAAIGRHTVIAVVVLAALGEIIELAAGTLGVARTGGSRRSALLALAGSLVGSVLGVVVGVPIPVVGSVIAAVFFAAVGAMAGAILGELSVGRAPSAGWQAGKAAFWGRLAGTLGKMTLGAIIVAVVVAAMLLSWGRG